MLRRLLIQGLAMTLLSLTPSLSLAQETATEEIPHQPLDLNDENYRTTLGQNAAIVLFYDSSNLSIIKPEEEIAFDGLVRDNWYNRSARQPITFAQYNLAQEPRAESEIPRDFNIQEPSIIFYRHGTKPLQQREIGRAKNKEQVDLLILTLTRY
jgi:hypothetical protein